MREDLRKAMKYQIDRVQTNDHGTFGVFSIDGLPVCVTLEETWLNNKPQVSCIPAGEYEVTAYSGTKYKDVWMVQNVPGRSAILMHWGNTERNTAGCILVGKYFNQFGDRRGVAESLSTIRALRTILPKKFHLIFKDCFN